jgi:hypothetical protein
MKIRLYLIAVPLTAISDGPERRIEVCAVDFPVLAQRIGGAALGTSGRESL